MLIPYSSIYSPISSASPSFFELSGGKECLCSFLSHFKRSGGEDLILFLLSICFAYFVLFVLMVAQLAFLFFFFIGVTQTFFLHDY